MKESYRKGLASHPGPESCVASREAAIEALTGGSAGRVWSCEIIANRWIPSAKILHPHPNVRFDARYPR